MVLLVFFYDINYLFSVHSSYFTNGEISTQYRDSVTVQFENKTAGRTYLAGMEDYTVVATLNYSNTSLYPSRRLLRNGTDVACDWMTNVTGDVAITECQAAIGFASGAALDVRVEAFLPPDYVIQSAGITVKFPAGKY